jgi:hypothetical protein
MKKIVRLTESDLARIVNRVINERQYLMEGVPNTTIQADGNIVVQSRTLCLGNDFIKASVVLSNTGAEDAYLKMKPNLRHGDGSDATLNGMVYVSDFSVTVKNKPSVGQADGQNQFKIPKGSKATLNIVIATRTSNIESDYQRAMKTAEAQPATKQRQEMTNNASANRKLMYDKIKNLKSAVLNLKYNGQPIQIPVNFGGFMVDRNTACDTEIVLPKGF